MTSFQIKSYLEYWLHAVDHHSLHSPFLYDFYTNVILARPEHQQFLPIERLRKEFRSNQSDVSLKGFGAGSKHFDNNHRKISSIAKTSLSSNKFSTLYWSITHYFNAINIVELGTSLGINTAYLAMKNDAQVTTFEGEPEIANLAQSGFKKLLLNNIQLIEGDITLTLPRYLENKQFIDLAFLDANHQYEPTLLYFESLVKKIVPKSVVILDDIHQSKAMENAWKAIKEHELVYGSIDLYRCGIVFFDPSLNKQHVVLQY